MLQKTLNSIEKFSNKEAFFIDEISYKYADFGKKITAIISEIEKIKTQENEIIGIIADNNFDTFASIYAVWFSGCAFVPLSINVPIERNQEIINQLNLKIILNTTENISLYSNLINIKKINTLKLKSDKIEINLSKYNNTDLSYILFTSGSTGIPKGVPISVKNINTFYNNFINLGYKINETDKFLQSFELTFDFSVKSYIIPLSLGASLYTPKKTGIKHLNIYKAIKKHNITFVSAVPSTVSLLKPYFKEINLPSVKYMLFAAEALTKSLMQEWQHCVPNATIINSFGPTETTIVCTEYIWKRNSENEAKNDNLSIGKPFGDNIAIIVDDNNNIVKTSENGILCISGNQVCDGYLNLPELNAKTFITINNTVFYKTGDIVFKSESGDLIYVGRADSQIQIQGHRVELGDISFNLKKLLPNNESVIITIEILNIQHIIAFVQNLNIKSEILKKQLSEILPHYMVPSYFIDIKEIPYSSNGKIDKLKLKEIFKNKYNE
jgi:amino acid adenylation domain-containing protein